MRRLVSFALQLVFAAARVTPAFAAAAFPALSAHAQDMKVIRIGAGPTGVTDFPFGGLVANAISNPPGSRECERGGSCGVPGLIAVAQTTDGPLENLKAVARGDIEMAMSQADLMAWAYHATGAFTGEPPLSNLRVIARLYPENLHLVTLKDSGIKSIADLKGKTVSVGPPGAGAAVTVHLLLSVFGVPWASVKMETLELAAGITALEKKTIAGFFLISGAPVLELEDLARRLPIAIVPIAGPPVAKLAQIYPFYSVGYIPAGSYGDHPVVPTLDVGSVLVARDSMDNDLAYGIARAIWHERNAHLFQAGHPRGKLMDPILAAKGLTVPLHPGAVRYYVMEGLMKQPPADMAANSPTSLTSPTSPTPPAKTGP